MSVGIQADGRAAGRTRRGSAAQRGGARSQRRGAAREAARWRPLAGWRRPKTHRHSLRLPHPERVGTDRCPSPERALRRPVSRLPAAPWRHSERRRRRRRRRQQRYHEGPHTSAPPAVGVRHALSLSAIAPPDRANCVRGAACACACVHGAAESGSSTATQSWLQRARRRPSSVSGSDSRRNRTRELENDGAARSAML